VKDKV